MITPHFSPDDRFLAGTAYGNKLAIWEIAAGDEYGTLTANLMAGKRRYFCPAISADGRLLVAGADGGVGFWDLPSRKNLAFIETAPGITLILLEPSGAFHGAKRPVSPVDPPRSGDRLAPRRGAEKLPVPGVPNIIAQSRDGRVLASAQFQGAVVLHADQPDRLINLGPHANVRGVAVSPDGQWVATGGFGVPGGAKVWEARTGKPVKDLAVGINCWVVFSPDGKRLLIASGGNASAQIRVWEVGTWAEVPIKEPLKGAAPTFSPDGKLLVVETGTGAARLLDPNTGREYARLEDPSQHRAIHFSFSPDSTKLVSATGDGHCLHIWDVGAMRRRLAEMGLDWDLP